MTTTYPGREDHHDLGDGHSFTWLRDLTGKLIGLTEYHLPGPEALPGALYCGGYIAWGASDADAGKAPPWRLSGHTLERGGPGDAEHLTIAPSLACRHCPCHGWIRDGVWIDA